MIRHSVRIRNTLVGAFGTNEAVKRARDFLVLGFGATIECYPVCSNNPGRCYTKTCPELSNLAANLDKALPSKNPSDQTLYGIRIEGEVFADTETAAKTLANAALDALHLAFGDTSNPIEIRRYFTSTYFNVIANIGADGAYVGVGFAGREY